MINERDLRIDITRNAGAYGTLQDVRVRITHVPTGLQGLGRDDLHSRSAKDAAMAELLAKLKAGGLYEEDDPDHPQTAAD